MQNLTKPGDYVETVAEGVTIRLQVTVDGAYDRRVYAGPTEIGELHTTHTDESLARTQCSHIRAALLSGVRVDQIALEHTTNGHTVVQVAEGVLAEALRVATADPNTIAAEPTVAALQGLLPVDDAADDDLVARINARLDQVHAVKFGQNRPATMAGTVPDTGHTNQSGVASKPTSDAMNRIVLFAAAMDGHIGRGGNADDGEARLDQLIALRKRGLVQLSRGKRGNQTVITGGWLTVKGWKKAGVAPKTGQPAVAR